MPKRIRNFQLTPAQEAFCLAYVQTGDRALAYTRSGGKGKNPRASGTRRLSSTLVQARIQQLRDEAADKVTDGLAATEEEVLRDIRWAAVVAKKGNLILDKNGKALRDDDGRILRRPDLPSLLKATELMGKTLAMFTDKRKIETEMESKSDAEIAQIIEAAIASDSTLVARIAQMPEVRKRAEQLQQAEGNLDSESAGSGGSRWRH